MPQTKNPLTRYKILDQLLGNPGRTYTFDELLDALNERLREQGNYTIGQRQLRVDIKFMKDEAGYNAPIGVSRSRPPIYKYADPNFSIQANALNAKEASLLGSALKMLERFEGSPQFAWIQELNPVIRDAFGLESKGKPVISFESNIDYQGYSNITPIFNAITNRRVLKVTYRTFSGNTFRFNFHPHYLKQYNQRWFAFGLNEQSGLDTWNVPLDRIQSIQEVREEYIESQINWEEYFENIVGVNTPKEGNLKMWF